MKTGQYYLRSRPARDAIQFTLDVDSLDVKDDGNYNSKNLSKAEMDENKRLRKKRPATEAVNPVKDSAVDLSKKRKTTEQGGAVETKETTTKETAEKPWEGKEEQEEDYRWNVCENC